MKKLLPLLLAAPLLTSQAQAAGSDVLDPLDPAYNFAGLSYIGGSDGYSAGLVEASVALGTLGGKDDTSDVDTYGLGIGFRIRTSEATSLDIDLAYAQQRFSGPFEDNHMVGLGLGFRVALGDRWILISRARYFISNMDVVNNTFYADDFLELTLGTSFYLTDRFSIDANLRKVVGQNDPFTYSIGGSFHF